MQAKDRSIYQVNGFTVLEIPYRSFSLHIALYIASFREFAIVAVTIEIEEESRRKRIGIEESK